MYPTAIRPWREADLGALPADIRAELATGQFPAWSRHPDCLRCELFAITHGGVVVGVLALGLSRQEPQLAVVGAIVVPKARRRGHATRALGLLARRAAAYGRTKIEATPSLSNVAMRRALRAAGFAQVGFAREGMTYRWKG